MSAERIEGFCPDYCQHAPCPYGPTDRACGTCGGPLSGPSAPYPRCVSCDRWEDECVCDGAWTYEADEQQDHGGADVLHHIVCGDRHIAEVETEEDAHLIIAAVNGLRTPPGESSEN